MIELKDLEDFLIATLKKETLSEITYDNFIELIRPRAKDFAELMI